MAGITKVFDTGTIANDEACLSVYPQTIHAIVGENGAGKTTLMNILFGRLRPDSGRIRIDGQDVEFRSPIDAIRTGLAMVAQHSSFIPALTVLENCMLGAEIATGGILRIPEARRRLEELAAKLGGPLPWDQRAEQLSVASLQRAEIVRALFRGARTLILDEPTAALSPPEAERLFDILHTLVATGHTILLVTHRLREVTEHAQHVTVLRGGRTVAEMPTALTTAAELSALMVGVSRRTYLGDPWSDVVPEPATEATGDAMQAVPYQPRPVGVAPMPVLELDHLSVPSEGSRDRIEDLTLTVSAGEIVGVAGVDGSGQLALFEGIAGVRPIQRGRVLLNGRDVTRRNTGYRLRAGLSLIPEDRQRDALILPFSITENILLGYHWRQDFGGGFVTAPKRARETARLAVTVHRIQPADVDEPAMALSGGNQQKLVLARALLPKPSVLVAMQPTRGLDLHATRHAYELIAAARQHGMGALVISLDLDELLEVSDRIAVLYAGRLAGIIERHEMDRALIGRLMTTGCAE